MAKQTSEFGKNWYAVHTYSGYEDAVARNLRQRIESLGMEGQIFQVVVPKEKKIKIKSGKRRIVEEEIYPGYVLVEMIVTDASWYVVRNTPRVTGFVGSGTTPVPLAKEEIDMLFSRMGKDEPTHKIEIYFWKGRVEISIDLTGEPMHRRGYRVGVPGPAPLRE